MGDFNKVVCSQKRKGCNAFSASMRHFCRSIVQSELHNLTIHERCFTWRNSTSGSRIDRCLVNHTTLKNWPSMLLTALPSRMSNHNPLLHLVEIEVDQGPRPFRSFDACWTHANFASFLDQSWLEFSDLSLLAKLHNLRFKLKQWNFDIFQNLNSKAKDLQSYIDAFELAAKQRDLQA